MMKSTGYGYQKSLELELLKNKNLNYIVDLKEFNSIISNGNTDYDFINKINEIIDHFKKTRFFLIHILISMIHGIY